MEINTQCLYETQFSLDNSPIIKSRVKNDPSRMNIGAPSRGLSIGILVSVVVAAGIIVSIVIYQTTKQTPEDYKEGKKEDEQKDEIPPEMQEQADRMAKSIKNIEEAMKQLQPSTFSKKKAGAKLPAFTVGEQESTAKSITSVTKSSKSGTNSDTTTLITKTSTVPIADITAHIEVKSDNTKVVKAFDSVAKITALSSSPLLLNFDIRGSIEVPYTINITQDQLTALKAEADSLPLGEKLKETLAEIEPEIDDYGFYVKDQLRLNSVGFKTTLRMLENGKAVDFVNFCKEAHEKAAGYQKTYSVYLKKELWENNQNLKVTEEEVEAIRALNSDPLWKWCMDNYQRGTNYCMKLVTEMNIWEARSRMCRAIQRRLHTPLLLENDQVKAFPSASYTFDLADLLNDEELIKAENQNHIRAIAKAILIDTLQDNPSAKASLLKLLKERLQVSTAREAELAIIAPVLLRLENSMNAAHESYTRPLQEMRAIGGYLGKLYEKYVSCGGYPRAIKRIQNYQNRFKTAIVIFKWLISYLETNPVVPARPVFTPMTTAGEEEKKVPNVPRPKTLTGTANESTTSKTPEKAIEISTIPTPPEKSSDKDKPILPIKIEDINVEEFVKTGSLLKLFQQTYEIIKNMRDYATNLEAVDNHISHLYKAASKEARDYASFYSEVDKIWNGLDEKVMDMAPKEISAKFANVKYKSNVYAACLDFKKSHDVAQARVLMFKRALFRIFALKPVDFPELDDPMGDVMKTRLSTNFLLQKYPSFEFARDISDLIESTDFFNAVSSAEFERAATLLLVRQLQYSYSDYLDGVNSSMRNYSLQQLDNFKAVQDLISNIKTAKDQSDPVYLEAFKKLRAKGDKVVVDLFEKYLQATDHKTAATYIEHELIKLKAKNLVIEASNTVKANNWEETVKKNADVIFSQPTVNLGDVAMQKLPFAFSNMDADAALVPEKTIEELAANAEKILAMPKAQEIIKSVFTKQLISVPYPEELCARVLGLNSNTSKMYNNYLKVANYLLRPDSGLELISEKVKENLDRTTSNEAIAMYKKYGALYKIYKIAAEVINICENENMK